jgi:hypothetical protein
MRKIETLMNRAIAYHQNWQKDNTSVIQREDGITEVRLYGNKIAELGDFFVTLYDGGFRSNTTKSRLNAILRENGTGNESVYQKDYEWRISYDGKDEEFMSGVTLR